MNLPLIGEPLRLLARLHAVGLGSLLVAGCAMGYDSADPTPDTDGMGSIVADLQISPGNSLNTVAYVITGPAAFAKTGSLDVHASSSLRGVIAPVPAGKGFSITLSGTSQEGNATCSGAAAFDITADETTAVLVSVTCHEAPRSGSVRLNGSLNVCPAIDSVVIGQTKVTVGNPVNLSGAAHDLDVAPAQITYRWTSDTGSFSTFDQPNTTFTCATAGTAHIVLSAGDGDPTPGCADTRSASIECVP